MWTKNYCSSAIVGGPEKGSQLQPTIVRLSTMERLLMSNHQSTTIPPRKMQIPFAKRGHSNKIFPCFRQAQDGRRKAVLPRWQRTAGPSTRQDAAG